MKSSSKNSFFRKSRFVNTVAIAYLFVAILAVILEFFKDKQLLYLVKPTVIPCLLFLYWCSTRRINTIYIFALAAVWLANLFANSNLIFPLVVGTLFLMVYKVFFIHIVNSSLKMKTLFPILVSAVPFILFYVLITIIIYKSVEDLFLLYISQCVIFIILGAYAMANFFNKSRRSSLYLLIAVVFLIFDQVLSIIFNGNFVAVGLFFFYTAHYLFCRFLVVDERRRRHHDSFNINVSPRID